MKIVKIGAIWCPGCLVMKKIWNKLLKKYEEEQEKKAIISYEQLVKNANNISLTYKEENIGTGAPKVNKIEIQEKEVTPPENYLKEEEFLNILKEFRLSLE